MIGSEGSASRAFCCDAARSSRAVWDNPADTREAAQVLPTLWSSPQSHQLPWDRAGWGLEGSVQTPCPPLEVALAK